MTNYDIAAWMVPLDSGLKKSDMLKVLSVLPEDCEIIPLEIHETNSSAYGFATIDAVDKEGGLETILDQLASVVEDWPDESSDYSFVLPSSKKVYVGCEFRTVFLGKTHIEEV